MLVPSTPSEQLLFSTVLIRDGTTGLAKGTGFAFHFDNMRSPVLLTCKHVVEGLAALVFDVHIDDNGTPSDDLMPMLCDPKDAMLCHPTADLCAIDCRRLRVSAAHAGKRMYLKALPETFIPSQQQLEGLSALEDVVMAGYPNGLWDKKNGFPLLRRGTSASHPAVDYDGEPTMMIDMACFPGSSGSPVLVLNEGNYANKLGGLVLGTRAYLLGVLSKTPIFGEEGKVYRQKPEDVDLKSVVPLRLHLGYVIKAREILAFRDILPDIYITLGEQ